jgi:hypothetical protein
VTPALGSEPVDVADETTWPTAVAADPARLLSVEVAAAAASPIAEVAVVLETASVTALSAEVATLVLSAF